MFHDAMDVSQVPRLVPIGPMVPDCAWGGEARALVADDNRGGDENEKSEAERWLDAQEAHSVLYISFGSLTTIGSEEQVRELALALEASPYPFLWVYRPPGLPQVNKVLDHSSPPSSKECIPPGTDHKLHILLKKVPCVRATKCLLRCDHIMYPLLGIANYVCFK